MAARSEPGSGAARWSSFRIGGTRVDGTTRPQAIAAFKEWIQAGRKAYVAFCTASTVVNAQSDPELRAALEEATLVTPDGMPLVWRGRQVSEDAIERVYGPDFMLDFFGATDASVRHFFYGGGPGVAQEMVRRLKERFDHLNVVGTLCPERVTGREIVAADVAAINAARPDVVWVGLGHPKQEKWMRTHRAALDAPVLAGVGAAFDFHAGLKKEAPRWMKNSGFQWLHRLIQEPRRLWRRYLIGNARFALLVLRDALRGTA